MLRIGLTNQNRLIGNSEQSIIDYNRFSACFVRKTEYSFLPNIITVVFRSVSGEKNLGYLFTFWGREGGMLGNQ